MMKRDPRTIILTLWRSLKLQCPACGHATIVERAFNIRRGCPICEVIFKREEGFFIGAIMANVVATEVLIIIVYLASLLLNFDERITLAILFVVGVTFPLAFYHHSWALWLGLDHLIEGLSREARRQ